MRKIDNVRFSIVGADKMKNEKRKDYRMLRTLTGIMLGASILASPVLAQSTTSTVLTGEAFGFQVMDSTTPDAFSFTSETDIEPNGIDVISNAITISGITEAVTASVSDQGTGGSPKISVNGALYTTSPVQVDDGDQIRVSILPDSGVFSQTYQAEVTIGGGAAIFQVSTRAADTTPDAFSFTALTGQEPATLVASLEVTITGIEAPSAVSVSGAAGAPQISLDGGSNWATSGTVANNGTILVRLTSGAFGETRTANVIVGGVSRSFSVTTRASSNTPALTSFTDQTGAEPGITVTSNAVTVTGLESTVTVSVSGNGLPEFEINGSGTWIAEGANATLSNNDTIRIRLTSGSFEQERIATVDVGGVQEAFSVTTRVGDTTPDAFTIAGVTEANPTTLIQSSTTISGIEAATAVTIAGDGGAEFSTDAGASWVDDTGSDTVLNGGTVLVRLTSGTFSETRTATLTVGGVTGTYSVTTQDQDVTPDAFAFTSETGAAGTTSVSEVVTLSGFTGSVSIAVSGSGSPEYQIDGGAWTSSAGTVTSGQDVRVRLTASLSEGATATGTLTVGGVSGDYTVTTQDLTPDAFAFNAVTGAAQNAAIVSDPVQISGLVGSTPISVSAGNGALYRVGTGPDAGSISWWADGYLDSTATGKTITDGQWVEVRLTSSSAFETEVTATLTIGNGSDVFSVTTGSEPVTVTLSAGSVPDGENGQAYAGFDFTALAGVSGGSASSPPSVNDLTWSVTAGALPSGMTLSAAGDLTGTPAEVGSFSFTVEAALGGDAQSRSYSIIVNDPDGSFVIEGG